MELPAGWAWAELGEVADTSLGKMLDKGKSSGQFPVPYLRNLNVQWGHIDLTDVLNIDLPPEERDHYQVKEGDLLICEGGEVGRCAIFPGSSGYMAFQKAIHRVRPTMAVIAKYLRYYIEYMSTSGKLAKFTTGSTIKHLPQQRLRGIEIPLPSIPEQRRIVDALETQISSLEKATSSVQRSTARAPHIWDAVLNSVAEGTLSDSPALAELRTVAEVADVSGGIQKQKKRQPLNNYHPFLRVANVARGGLDLRDVHQIELFDGELEKHRLIAGDLLVVEGNGSPDQIGRAATWHGNIPETVHQNHLIRVRPGPDLIPRYLELVWNAPVVINQLREVARSTSGLYTLSTSKAKSVRIPVPQLSIQRALVDEADRWETHTRAAQQVLGEAVKRSTSLKNALLARSFTGRLVPQDPGDEPASELLARIKTERAAQPKSKRARRAPSPRSRKAGKAADDGQTPAPPPTTVSTPLPQGAVQQKFEVFDQ